MNIEQYLDPQYGIIDYLLEQKKAGRIKHFGFSCHGEMPVLEKLLEAHGADMEFCQLQLNYLDWTFQHGKEKVELLDKYDIPVWVMEPLRGGSWPSSVMSMSRDLRISVRRKRYLHGHSDS